jgi:pyruvate/2-oxoglutarate dehydrogenase complex dihydrolipoamide acyltransferase (E2) component
MQGIVNHRASVQGAVTAVEASVGATVSRGAVLLRLESMKMEFTVEALADGVVRAVHVQRGDAVDEGDLLLDLAPVADAVPRVVSTAASAAARPDLDDLQKNTPADGLITGTGLVHASEFGLRARALRGDDL